MYTPPRASTARDAAILICSPIGLEYLRTHYAMRLLAKQLSDAGLHVLRFDYHGTGDSSGEVGAGQFDVWVNDVALAADELLEISGVDSLTVVGLRTGAQLAIEALARKGLRVRGLVLWDPVISGREYIAMLERMQSNVVLERITPPQPTDELLGSHFPTDLRAAIEGFDMESRVRIVDADAAAVVVSEDQPEYRALLTGMQGRWPDTMYRTMDDPAKWDSVREAFDVHKTGPIVRAVAEVAESLV